MSCKGNELFAAIVISVAAFIVSSAGLYAGEPIKIQNLREAPVEKYRFDVKVGYAFWPAGLDYKLSPWGEDLNDSWWSDGTVSKAFGDYGDWTGYTTGTFTAEFNTRLTGWLSVSMFLGYNQMWRDIYAGLPGKDNYRLHAASVYFMPQVKFNYLRRPIVNLYSAVSTGVVWHHNVEKLINAGHYNTNEAALQFQLVPIGISIGRRLYGFTQVGLGTVYCGFDTGIGYRF